MAAAPVTPRRFATATLALIAAALLAIVSIAIAVLRAGGGAERDPQAKDWRTVGWAYAEKGDADASAAAYRRAAGIEPENAENWSSLGEALQSHRSSVVPEAAAALEKAIELDPSDPRARYFLAVQKDLAGDHRGALADWSALDRDTPPDAPWRADLQRTIAQTAERYKIYVPTVPPAGLPVATAAIPGPTADQMTAAGSIPPAAQDEMVRGMVDRLARRLESNPRDADGWIRLMRSRAVLNDAPGARRDLASALKTFRDDPAAQARLKSAAAELGIDEG
jgi:cytochrome c-type biogenesis protein CcmH